MTNKTQAEKTNRAFELISEMVKQKTKHLADVAMQQTDRNDLKTVFRAYDNGK
jgi:hypothetical protein